MWRAGGVENDQRGAWSKLVAAHGAGRAGWLADSFQPVNIAEEPIKSEATDEILVIATTAPPGAADAIAISSYWQSVWVADGDAAQVAAANATLSAAVGASHAADLISGYAPFNLSDSPVPLAKTAVNVSTAFVVFPADPATNLQSWSQAPRVNQFPDRFVVLGFNGASQTLEAVGAPVTLRLYAGPDPSVDPAVDPTATIHPDGAELFVPDQLKWMVDFDSAVAAGMGLAIPLSPEQYRQEVHPPAGAWPSTWDDCGRWPSGVAGVTGSSSVEPQWFFAYSARDARAQCGRFQRRNNC